MEMEKFKKFMKRGAAVAVMCGAVLAAGVAEAGKMFTVIELVNNGEPFEPGITQKEMARRGQFNMIVGQFQCNVDHPGADPAAYNNACWGIYGFHLHPKAVLRLPWLTPESKQKLQEYIDKLGSAGLEKRAESRSSDSVTTAPQPFGSIPYPCVIVEGDPAWITDKSGKIIGIDVDNTIFVGSPGGVAALAYVVDTALDMNGYSGGRVLGKGSEEPPGITLRAIFNRHGSFLENNPQGENDFTYKEKDIISEYWLMRERFPKASGEQIGKLLSDEHFWGARKMQESVDVLARFYNNRARSILANPTSNIKRVNNDKLVAKMYKNSFIRRRI